MEGRAKTVWILYLALLASIGIYFGITFVVPAQGVPDPETLGMMEYIFLGMGAVSTIMSFVLPKILLASAQQAADPWGPYFTRKVLSWALSESVAIYGLILYFMSGEHENMAIFAIWAAVLMAVHSPRDVPS